MMNKLTMCYFLKMSIIKNKKIKNIQKTIKMINFIIKILIRRNFKIWKIINGMVEKNCKNLYNNSKICRIKINF